MSGHSKFANIKHKKEKNDAAKGKIFTIIGREIAVAVKDGGPDPANNFKLAQVIAKAKASNMPNDTIERGIKKASGEGNSVNYEYCTYEGYGPSGTAIIVKCLTDNKNRTAANVRNAFTKGHGSIGTQGCVSYMFDEKGQIKPEAESSVMHDLRAHFRPEFLNRLDEIIMFKPLTKDNVGKIVDLMVKELSDRLADQELSLELTDAAKQMVVDNGYDPVYGARPLKRYLQNYVETLTAKKILSGDVHAGDTIVLDVKDGAFTVSTK